MATAEASPKRPLACTFCRRKKIRCEGGNPCPNCIDHEEACIYSPRRRRRQKLDPSIDPLIMARKIARFERLLQTARPASALDAELDLDLNLDLDTNVHARTAGGSDAAAVHSTSTYDADASGTAVPSLPPDPGSSSQQHQGPSRSGPAHDRAQARRRRASTVQENTIASYSPTVSPAFVSTSLPHSTAVDDAWDPPHYSPLTSATGRPSLSYPARGSFIGSVVEDQEDSSIFSALTSGLEYHGPRTSMALCSKPGIDWVKSKVQDPEFHVRAQRFNKEVARRLKIEKPLSVERKPEPSEHDGWRFTTAYFDEAHDAAFGIVHRPWFEAKLRAHFQSDTRDEESAWYALRNAIYASGCRILTAKTSSFLEAQQAAWPWFENALSVHSQLMYWHSTVIGVQALTVMAYFTEAISTPTLQYMLLSTAIKLAVAKGLHRQPSALWDLPPGEENLRRCTFWALYCLEKQIASRSGRPCTIEDDEISCQVPTVCPPHSSVHMPYYTMVIRLCQLSSLVGKRLSSVRGFHQSPEQLVHTVADLSERLDELRRSFHTDLDVDLPLNLAQPPRALNNHQALTVQFIYYSLIWDIHTVLTYPWFQSSLNMQHPTLRSRIQASTATVATTSRAAILDTRYIRIDANCSLLVGYYVPLYAQTNLFIHVLADPRLASVKSDLVLLEVGTGHFARLDFDTESWLAAPLVKDLGPLARKAYESAKGAVDRSASGTTPTAADTPPRSSAPPPELPSALMSIDGDPNDDWLGSNFTHDFEMWSIMLPPIDGTAYLDDAFL